MKTANDLRDQRAELAEELDVMVEIAKEEKRDLTEKESTRSDEILSSLDNLDDQIKKRERLEERLASKADADQVIEVRHKKQPKTEEKKIVKRYNFLKAIQAYSTRDGKLDGVEAEMHQEAVREAKMQGRSIEGLGVPGMFFRHPSKRDMVAGTPTAGGNTIQTDVANELIDYLWPRTTVENLGATVLSGLTSNVSLPRKSAVPTATWEGEVDPNAESNPTTDTISLSPNRLGTHVDISKQLLLQTQVPGLDGIIRGDIENSIAQALETAILNGSGSGNQPTGLLNDNNIGVIAVGANGGAPDWANIVDMEQTISSANADMGSLAYLTTPGMRGLLKTTEKASSTAQFIWENNVMGGVTSPTVGEGQLNGYRAAISTLVPSNLTKGSGINLHAVIFANWADQIIAQFGGMDIVIDPYTQATNTLLRIVVNSWWDIDRRHSASFAAIKDASAGEFNT